MSWIDNFTKKMNGNKPGSIESIKDTMDDFRHAQRDAAKSIQKASDAMQVQNSVGNFGSFRPNIQQPPQWTAEDQAELEKEEADMEFRKSEERAKAFMAYPEEIREAIIERKKKQLVDDAIERIDNFNVHYAQKLIDLQHKKYQAGSHHYTLDKHNLLQTYEELCKLHAEASTHEIIIGDKRK